MFPFSQITASIESLSRTSKTVAVPRGVPCSPGSTPGCGFVISAIVKRVEGSTPWTVPTAACQSWSTWKSRALSGCFPSTPSAFGDFDPILSPATRKATVITRSPVAIAVLSGVICRLPSPPCPRASPGSGWSFNASSFTSFTSYAGNKVEEVYAFLHTHSTNRGNYGPLRLTGLCDTS